MGNVQEVYYDPNLAKLYLNKGLCLAVSRRAPCEGSQTLTAVLGPNSDPFVTPALGFMGEF
jgi:hypothetical protein